MTLPSLRVLALALGAAIHAGGFHLVGSTWKLQTPGAGASTFTAYRYDDAGHRIRETVFSPDSTGSIGGESVFEYDSKGGLLRTIVLTAADTSSIAIVSRDPEERVLATTVLAKGNALKYVDSNAYQGDFLARTWRTNGSGKKVSLHRYGSSEGISKTDSLFAPAPSGLLALTGVLVARLETGGRVASEASWQCDSNGCFQTSTRRMKFSGLKLESVEGLEGDGSSGVLVDSIHYRYDAFENRIAEDRFDADRLPTQSWTFSWLADPLGWLDRRPVRSGGPALVGRELSVPPLARDLVLLDALGRVRWAKDLAQQARITLPASLGRGGYLAVFSLPQGRLATRLLVGD